VLEALSAAEGEPAESYEDPRVALAVARALATLSARELGMRGVELIFVSLRWPDGLAPELRALLEGTPAGDYLRSMEARETAWAVRQAERAAAYMSPEAVAQRKVDRRERRRLMKLPEMEERAARKAERDRLWRLRQAPES
jgi:hypothetical protein